MSNARKKTGPRPAISPGRPGQDQSQEQPRQDPPQDDARQAEAQDDSTTATIEFRGHTFTISRYYDDMSVDFIESIEEGKTVGIVRGALGPRQWQRVRQMNLAVKDLTPLMRDIVSVLGFADMGESQPSSD